MRRTAFAAAATALLFLVACERVEHIQEPQIPEIGANQVVDPAIVGKWVLQAGDLIPDVDATVCVTGFEVFHDGTALVYFRDLKTGAKVQIRAFCIFDGTTLALDLAREPALSLNPSRTMLFPVVIVDRRSLQVADANGVIGLFSKEKELPPEVMGRVLPFELVASSLPRPNSFGDLIPYDGGLVYNSNDDRIERFDLATATLAAPLGPTSSRFLQTSQPASPLPHFWSHCGCGGSPDVFRRDLSIVYDTVHTGNDLGLEITVRSGEFHPPTSRLWLHGFTEASSRGTFLVVDATGEPDVLVETFDFNRSVRGLAFDGTHFWALVTALGRVMVRIDPATAEVLESYALPDPDVFWTGLAFDEAGSLYAIGTNRNLEGVLYKTEVEAAVPDAVAVVAK